MFSKITTLAKNKLAILTCFLLLFTVMSLAAFWTFGKSNQRASSNVSTSFQSSSTVQDISSASANSLSFVSSSSSQSPIFDKNFEFGNKDLSKHPKPWLLANTQFNEYLLDQNNQLIIPAADYKIKGSSRSLNLEPIQIGDIIYFPYLEGKIAVIDTQKQTLSWVQTDFQIADMSVFNGKYYLTEINQQDFCDYKQKNRCNIWEVDRQTLAKKSIFANMSSGHSGAGNYGRFNQSLSFADQDYFWLKNTGTLCTAGPCGDICQSESRAKYDLKTGKFIEAFMVNTNCKLYKSIKEEYKDYLGINIPVFTKYDELKREFIPNSSVVYEDSNCIFDRLDNTRKYDILLGKCKDTNTKLNQIMMEKTYNQPAAVFAKKAKNDKSQYKCGDFSYDETANNKTGIKLVGDQTVNMFGSKPIVEEWKQAYDWTCIN